MKKILVILVFCTFLPGLAFTWSEPSYIIDSIHADLDPVATYTPDDEMFVVWFSAWATHYYDVSFAKVAEDGSLSIEPTRIFTEDGVADRAPTVAVDSQNNAHIFWRRQSSGELNIWYMQVDAADGSYLVDPMQLIDSNTPGDIFMYAVPDVNDNIHLLYCTNSWDGDVWWDQPMHAKIASDGTLLAYDHAITNDSYYEVRYFDKGIVADPDGNVHIVYTYYCGFDSTNDYSIVYRKIDGDDGTWLTSLIDISYPTTENYTSSYDLNAPFEPYDLRPAIGIDNSDYLHIAFIHLEEYQKYIAYTKMTLDGIVELEPELTYYDEEIGFGESNWFITSNDDYYLFANSDVGIAVFEFDNNGNLIDGPYYNEMMIGHSQVGPFGNVGDSDFIRVVGHHRVDSWDYDILYFHQIDDSIIDEARLKTFSDDDGILLSWSEEGDLTGSSWCLERDGERLVNLSGDSLYRYLDRNAEPGVTHLYTLEATLPDGSIRHFGPVEATWPGPDSDRFTLYAPYPCPATDRVTLSFHLPEDTSSVELSLYDLSGRFVASSISLSTAPGRHEITYDTSALPSGVYVARLSTNAGTFTHRLVITR